jgi:hypothetical protein
MSKTLHEMMPWALNVPSHRQVQFIQLVPESLYGAFIGGISEYSEDDLFRLHIKASEIALALSNGLDHGSVVLVWRNRILSGLELMLAGKIARTTVPALIISSHWEPFHASTCA